MMTLEKFQQLIADGKPLEGNEMVEFMREQSDISRRIQLELNCHYHTPEEIRDLFSQITGKEVDESFRMFPPFYTDFGRNIHIGKNVFINSCCQFQDQGGIYIGDGCLIGHSVVMATLNDNICTMHQYVLVKAFGSVHTPHSLPESPLATMLLSPPERL